MRNYDQTGNPLYANAAIPAYFHISTPAWQRMFSFKLGAFLHGGYYYDDPIRQSYPSALVTSLPYGEYGMDGCQFRWPTLLRLGCLGLLMVLLAGAVIRPRQELRPVWITCLSLLIFQTIFMVVFVVQYPIPAIKTSGISRRSLGQLLACGDWASATFGRMGVQSEDAP
ncbi:MAG: hypothetical protein ACLQVY_25735 [Limisphaerales bacterium]